MAADILAEAAKSIERVQKFDSSQLPLRDVLGSSLSFDAAVEPAERIIRLFQQLPIEHLGRGRAATTAFQIRGTALKTLQDGQYPFREDYYPLAAMVMTEAPPELEAFLATQAVRSPAMLPL